MGEVDDAHDPEDEREPAGEQEEERAVGDAVEGLRRPRTRRSPDRGHGWRFYYDAEARWRPRPERCAPRATCRIVRGTSPRRAAVKLPPERFDYSPIVSRRPWKLPKGARIAVWTIVNVEEWDIQKAMARQYLTAPQGVATVPDVPNWAWHDYGMRVGFWRLLEALHEAEAPGHHVHQRPRVRELRAGGAGHARRGLGVHGPRGRPGRHAPPARPARGHSRVHRDHPEVHRHEAQGLAGSRPHRDVGDAGLPRRGRASSTSRTG